LKALYLINYYNITKGVFMLFQVKVRVNVNKLTEFAQKLLMGELDRSCIRGETYCLKSDPAVGYSIWEAESMEDFETKFSAWKDYYTEASVEEVINPMQAMLALSTQVKK
jgi:hypothetical protein